MSEVRRDKRRGIILLSTLVLLLLIGSVISVTQTRLLSSAIVVARLEADNRDALAERSVRERIRPLLAAALTGQPTSVVLALDGTLYTFSDQGRIVNVQARDLSGLIDLYAAPNELLDILPLQGVAIVQGRSHAVSDLAPGDRYVVLEQTLARFGLSRSERLAVSGYVAQSGLPLQIYPDLVPSGLRTAIRRKFPDAPSAATSGHVLVDVIVER